MSVLVLAFFGLSALDPCLLRSVVCIWSHLVVGHGVSSCLKPVDHRKREFGGGICAEAVPACSG